MDEVNPRAALLWIVDSSEKRHGSKSGNNSLVGSATDGFRGLSAKRCNWRRAKKRGRQAPWGIATPLRQLRQLAERVEFPEKNATVCQFRASFGGRGRIPREKCGFRGLCARHWRRGPIWIASRGQPRFGLRAGARL